MTNMYVSVRLPWALEIASWGWVAVAVDVSWGEIEDLERYTYWLSRGVDLVC